MRPIVLYPNYAVKNALIYFSFVLVFKDYISLKSFVKWTRLVSFDFSMFCCYEVFN